MDSASSKAAVDAFNAQRPKAGRQPESSESADPALDVKSVRLRKALEGAGFGLEEARQLLTGETEGPSPATGQTGADRDTLLSMEQLAELEEYKVLMDAQDMALIRDRRQVEYMREAFDRNVQLEGRLETIPLRDYVLREFVTQLVPIVPGQLEIRFRSMTPEQEILMRELVAVAAKELTEAAHPDSDLRIALGQLYEVCFMVEDVLGEKPWPVSAAELHRLSHAPGDRKTRLADLRAALAQNLDYWRKRPGAWVQQVVVHLHAFQLRMRRQMDTAGLEKLVGES